MRRHIRRTGFRLVAFDHHLGEIAEARRQRRGIEQLRGYRIDVAEIVYVLAEGGAQLVELAVAGAVADQHLEAQPGLAPLPQEQGDIRVIPAMEMTSAPARLSFVTSEERSGALAE